MASASELSFDQGQSRLSLEAMTIIHKPSDAACHRLKSCPLRYGFSKPEQAGSALRIALWVVWSIRSASFKPVLIPLKGSTPANSRRGTPCRSEEHTSE